MAERKHADHWDLLAADIGATPPTPQDEKKPDDEEQDRAVDQADQAKAKHAPVEEKPPRRPHGEAGSGAKESTSSGGRRGGSRVVSGFSFPRGPVNWAQLAGELGVEPTADMVEPPSSSSSSSQPTQSTQSGQPSADEPLEAEIVPAAGRGGDDPALPDQAVEVGQEDAAGTKSLDPQAEETKPSGRRRRRRRPRKGSPQTESDSPEPTPSPAGETELVEATAEQAAQAEEEPERTASGSKRRGRGRGGRKRGGKKPSESADTPAEAEAPEPVPAGWEEEIDTTDPGQPSAGKGTGSAKSDPSAKKSHRGIPSWQEAISGVTDANLERRAKKAEAAPGRGRGGRRRRGGSDKPDRGK